MNLKKKIISTIFFVFLLFLAYFLVFKNYSIPQFLHTLKTCKTQYFLLAVMCMFSFVFFEALFFKIILKKLGYKINWYQAFGYVFTEVYFSGITPSSTGGQPIQMVEMSKDKIPYRISSIIVLINTMFYKLALLIILLIGFIIFHEEIFKFSTIFKVTAILGSIVTVLIILFFVCLIFSERFVGYIIKLLLKTKKFKNKDTKLNDALNDYAEAAKYIRENPKVLASSFISIFMQRLSLLLVSYFVYKSFNINNISIFFAITIQAYLTIATDFVPIPGGILVSESLFIEVNEILKISSLSRSITIIFRSISFYILILVSLLYYLVFHFKKRKPAIKIEN